jgi:type I restriction enzyme S subunit
MKNNWQKVKLGEIATYSDTRIRCSDLTVENYVGTDNIKQNKEGKMASQYVPENGFTTGYIKNDILVANIRPYLKKIWFATNEGGSSADVLTIRVSNEKACPKFVYYNLFQNRFFDYAMKGAKGSKMPRGDKRQIMDFEIFLPPLSTQKSISKILSLLDEKIELNRQIFSECFALARLFYTYTFLQNKKQEWKMEKLGEVADVCRGKTITRKETKEGEIPVVAGGTDFAYYHNVANQKAGAITCSGSGANAGYLNYWQEPIWVSDCSVVRTKDEKISQDYLWLALLNKQAEIFKMQKGSAQPHVYPEDLARIEIVIPDPLTLTAFQTAVRPLFSQILSAKKESADLAKLRDWLLPLLMNGEVSVERF